MEFGYCKAAVSKTLTMIALHVVLLCVFAAAEDEANVISFQAERDLIPVGQPMSYTCKVKGRAVWEFGTYYFNTASSDFVGNRSNLIDGVNITDFTDASGNHLSKLFLSSSIVQSLNDTDMACSATTSLTIKPPVNERIRVKVFSSPTSPGNVRVVSERQKEVTLTWEPSFLPFNISPQYKVYVDGVVEATMEQPSFVFSKLEHSCDSHQIRVEAYNEVGSNTSEHIEVVLPAVPEVGALSDSISTDITKSGAQVQFTVSFDQAVSCPAHPVTNYTVTLTSNTSTPITRTVTTPPEDNVSITVAGLNDNTLYTYQVHANNAIGSTASAVKTFYTTDVLSGTAMEMNEGTLFLRCEFVPGSNALGCQVQLETLTRLGNLTHSLYRSQPDAASVDAVINITNPSCYDKMLVFDIESDNTTGNLGMPGKFHVSGNKPCTAPLSTEGTPVSTALIIGASVGGAIAVVLAVVILVVICCVLKNRAFGNSVKDTTVWIRNQDQDYPVRYSPNKQARVPSREEPQENKLPIYDSVDTYRQTSTRDSVPSPDYELLKREFGNLRSPPPPSSPKHGDTPTYAQLNSDPYSEPLRLPDFAEPYEQHVPAYAEPYEITRDPVYQTLDDAASVPSKKAPPTTPPPAHYSQVADALPIGWKVKTVGGGGGGSRLTLPQQRSGSRTSLSQV
ncbi:uncharacterized protein LOC135344329 isoform X2 [Halichondria panicea]|uniref:uncharacterized protein LOC135344329 isoform X2 n=1 Tax=Halichondria panicea TaxID=6063 RepID=UPI00312B8CDA